MLKDRQRVIVGVRREFNHQENEEQVEDDEEEKEDEYVGTPSYYSLTNDENKTKVDDNTEGDEAEEMDYTTSQLYDDVEKDVSEVKKDDPLKTQVTALVDEHHARLRATKDEFMSYLSASITAKITKQVKIQLPQILPKEESSQLQSSYKAAATLTEFELKKILIDKMDKSQSYLMTSEHKECYDGLIKSYDLDKSLFSTYGNVYLLKRRNDKDKDEDPSAGSNRGLKKRKKSKDADPTKGPKTKESKLGSSKGTKSQPKYSGKLVQSKEPDFEVADSDMPQDQEGNLGNDDDEPMKETISKRDWFTKPTQPQEPTDPNWNDGKNPQQEQTQNWLMTLAASLHTS
ncbi:hypothetical protein Tco_0490349 [Tanacetum coccineum]